MKLTAALVVCLLQSIHWLSDAKRSTWGPYTGGSTEQPGWTLKTNQLNAEGGEIDVDYHYNFVPKELFNTSFGKTLPPAMGNLTREPEYPGRPEGQCTSTGVQCVDLIGSMDGGFPIHITDPEEGCTKGRYKLIKDVYGRPMTMRFMHNGETLIKTREQVCNVGQADARKARALESETLDDMIWRNLTIWAMDMQSEWGTLAKTERYIKCHALFAQWHCSNVFPNCTAELEDRKPALPCRELCLEMNRVCKWSASTFFLPYEVPCDDYPSAFDQYRACTVVPVVSQYLKRVSGVAMVRASYIKLCTLAIAMLYILHA